MAHRPPFSKYARSFCRRARKSSLPWLHSSHVNCDHSDRDRERAAGRAAFHMDVWTEAMLRGDFDAAWKISDRVLQRRLRNGERSYHLPRHWQWLWDGRDLGGAHVLVHCYHGLGDTLQFVRLLPLLRERCAGITLWLQPALLDLLRSIEGVDRIEP